jgi:hypothetical protein
MARPRLALRPQGQFSDVVVVSMLLNAKGAEPSQRSVVCPFSGADGKLTAKMTRLTTLR